MEPITSPEWEIMHIEIEESPTLATHYSSSATANNHLSLLISIYCLFPFIKNVYIRHHELLHTRYKKMLLLYIKNVLAFHTHLSGDAEEQCNVLIIIVFFLPTYEQPLFNESGAEEYLMHLE